MVSVSNCKELWIARRKHQHHSPNCRERPLILKMGLDTIERQTDRRTERGRMQCFMKKEDKSLIDAENVETTYLDNCAFFASFVSVVLLSHSVQLTSPSSLVCSLFYHVGIISLNIATTSVRRLTFVL